jgi:hypothetical protein
MVVSTGMLVWGGGTFGRDYYDNNYNMKHLFFLLEELNIILIFHY